jgi:hypothetical protein
MAGASGIQYDEQGRPYSLIGGTTKRSYLSPVAMGTGKRPEDTSGFFRMAPQWNTDKATWDNPINWQNIGTLAVGGIAGAAVAPAVMGAAGHGGFASQGVGQTAAHFGSAAPAAVSGGAGVGGAGMAGMGGTLANYGMQYGMPMVGSYLQGRQQEQNQKQDIALKESTQNPFRGQMSQAQAIALLDLLERGSYTPMKMQPAGRYAQYVPQTSGGYSYTKSPELIAGAGQLKRSVLQGQGMPTMTDSANWGKTGAQDLTQGQPGSQLSTEDLLYLLSLRGGGR